MKTFAVILAAAAAVAVMAECPNGCSGHGTCGNKDACDCFDNWMGGDCSQRVCPFGLSFVDTPLGDLDHSGDVGATASVGTQLSNANQFESGWASAEGHFYSECSNKGFCDRSSGECACFDGFTGSSCQRTTCPNDCSGHGQCYTLREIAAGSYVAEGHPDGNSNVGRNFKVLDFQYGTYTTSGVSAVFDYNLWDADKNQACACDPGFFGPDCSMRMCPKGNDPLTNEPKHCSGSTCTSSVQYAYIGHDGQGEDTDFYLEWESSEAAPSLLDNKLRSEIFTVKSGLTGDEYAELLQDALETFPNGALNGVTVSCEAMDQGAAAVASHLECNTALTDTDEIELKLDFTNGPQGAVNGLQAYVTRIENTGASMDRDDALSLTFRFDAGSGAAANVQADADATMRARLGLSFSAGSFDNAYTDFDGGAHTGATPKAGNQENSPCSNRGLCDYATGTCQCFAGYTREDCSVQNALAM
jgi:hypothetical protein